MRVRLLTNLSNVRGMYEGGTLLDLDEAEARAYISMGLAEAVATEPEAAMLGDAPARATLPRAKPRGT